MCARFRFWPARRFPKTLTDREIPSDASRDKGVAKDEPIANAVIRNAVARANEVKASAAEVKAAEVVDLGSVV